MFKWFYFSLFGILIAKHESLFCTVLLLVIASCSSIANSSSMEMFDVGPTLGASIAHLSRTEVPWVGSTSGATVANVLNIDVFEVGANIALLS